MMWRKDSGRVVPSCEEKRGLTTKMSLTHSGILSAWLTKLFNQISGRMISSTKMTICCPLSKPLPPSLCQSLRHQDYNLPPFAKASVRWRSCNSSFDPQTPYCFMIFLQAASFLVVVLVVLTFKFLRFTACLFGGLCKICHLCICHPRGWQMHGWHIYYHRLEVLTWSPMDRCHFFSPQRYSHGGSR